MMMGDKLHTKNNKYTLLYSCFEGKYNIQGKITLIFFYQSQRQYSLKQYPPHPKTNQDAGLTKVHWNEEMSYDGIKTYLSQMENNSILNHFQNVDYIVFCT